MAVYVIVVDVSTYAGVGVGVHIMHAVVGMVCLIAGVNVVVGMIDAYGVMCICVDVYVVVHGYVYGYVVCGCVAVDAVIDVGVVVRFVFVVVLLVACMVVLVSVAVLVLLLCRRCCCRNARCCHSYHYMSHYCRYWYSHVLEYTRCRCRCRWCRCCQHGLWQ